MENKNVTLKEALGGKEGIKLDYGKLRKRVLQCEIDKESGRINKECREAFRELNIDIIEW